MPGRQSTGPAPLLKARAPKRKRKRALDAFALAAEEHNIVKTRPGRLGHLEGTSGPEYTGDDGDADVRDGTNQDSRPFKRSRDSHSNFTGDDIDDSSDSDEEAWVTGQVPSDNDSSLDSDEAMGESDEERFEGFAFRGSSSAKARTQGQPPKKLQTQVDPDEDDGASRGPRDFDTESEDFAAEAVDMSEVLDQHGNGSEKGSGDDQDASSKLSFSDEEEAEPTPSALYGLQKFIGSLDRNSSMDKSKPLIEMHEGLAVSSNGISTGTKPNHTDILGKHNDPKIRKQLRSKRDELSVPLAKRQQDRIDRAAAYDKSKETLGRWIETVKQNRRAERLHFPLTDLSAAAAKSNLHMSVDSTTEPINGLEMAIQNILEESGMTGQLGKSSDEQIQAFEELKTNKMPIDEVRKRRAQLRQSRELLFREEVRAKRIKKIKSKSWRRVHRKERERNAQREREMMAEAGIEPDEEDEERLQRLRAEERVSGKHRSSRWAKGVKATRRGVWDEEARNSMHEMARREEELKKRIEGRDPDADSMNGSESDTNSEGSEDEAADLSRRLQKLDDSRETKGGPHAGLHSLAFMQKAEAARKARNDEDVERLRRELADEPSLGAESDENVSVGRRAFGPRSVQAASEEHPETIGEFEERAELGDSDLDPMYPAASIVTERPATKESGSKGLPNKAKTDAIKVFSQPEEAHNPKENPWITVNKPRSKGGATYSDLHISTETQLPVSPQKKTPLPQISQKDQSNEPSPKLPAPSDFKTVNIQRSDEPSETESEASPQPTNQALIRQAFEADGDLIAKEFEAEKDALEAEEAAAASGPAEEERMPGWGSWVGEGLSSAPQKPSERAPRTGRGNDSTRSRGVAAVALPATGLLYNNGIATAHPRVILSAKTVKANAPYRATQLPYPFETQAQYERALRLPVGQEWVTRHTFLDGTTPRVNVKKGEIIRAMRKPLA